MLGPKMRRIRTILGFREKRVKTSFSSLADELIQEVLRYLRWPTDLYMLSLVCRLLYLHATPELYSKLVIAYLRPERISALLALLENKPERLLHVTTLLFDEDVKSIGPALPARGRWPSPFIRSIQYRDGWDPSYSDPKLPKKYPYSRHHIDIARRLHVILPSLPNLKRVYMRSLHPDYRLPAVFAKFPELSSIRYAPRLPGSSTALVDQYPDVDAERSIWEYIAMGSPRAAEIYVDHGPGDRMVVPLLLTLTTVSISHLFYNTRDHNRLALYWNTILHHTPNVRALCMVHVQHGKFILDGCFFPKLHSLELYRTLVDNPRVPNSPDLVVFLHRHSPTLRVFALSPNPAICDPTDHIEWLANASILPRLHTLRLGSIRSLLLTVNQLVYAGDASLPKDERARRWDVIDAEHTETVIDFVRKRPQIVDLAISGLQRLVADDFAQELLATRPMRNLCVGSAESQSLKSRLRLNPSCRAYSHEAWVFYELFGGLKLTESGFRPRFALKPLW